MSPRGYILSFSVTASSEQINNALRAATKLGAISPGTKDREHFIVISYLSEFERFKRVASEWQSSGMAFVRPLGS